MDRQLYLAQIDRVISEGPYKDDWASLSQHPIPAWYKEKRLGIFLHWGPFSVPAYHDWYARNMYIKGNPEYEHHLRTFGTQKEFGYKQFIPMLTMESFDPDEWVRAFTEAGADYIVPVAEHHDGFQMYESSLSDWNAVRMGPRRDVMGDLLYAAERAGMTRGASSHRIEHWWFMSHGKEIDSDIPQDIARDDLYWPAMPEPENQHDVAGGPAPSDEFMTDWLLRCCELIDRYHLRILYFDWWIQHEAAKPYLKKFLAYYFNRAEAWGGCVINYKHDALPFGIGAPTVERGQFSDVKPFLWQSDTSVMRGSWCYSEQPQLAVYKEPIEIIWDLADVVCKNGRLLLNFGPTPAGTLTPQDYHILKTLGGWMKINGEAIRGTGVWRTAFEGPTAVEEGQFADGQSRAFTSEDVRYTCRGGDVYAIVMRCPQDGVIRLRSLCVADASHKPVWNGVIRRVEILGMGEAAYQRNTEALTVDMGSYRSDLPVVVKIVTD